MSCQGVYSVASLKKVSYLTDIYYGIRKCDRQGLLCKDCETLVRCIADGAGFGRYPVAICNKSAGEYCNKDYQCSTAPNPACANEDYRLYCNDIGMFPDPFNCKKFFMCPYIGYHGIAFRCGNDYAYNMVTTFCDIKLRHCSNSVLPVPFCQRTGQMGALANKSLWYICVFVNGVITPQLHVCPNGKFFVDHTCVERNKT